MSRTWFITGASRGLGRSFAQAALDRGDRVTATARSVDALDHLQADADHLLRLSLDVTDVEAARDAVTRSAAQFGEVDVVVNNAGSGQLGAVEEVTDAAFRSVMDVNLFGAIAVSRCALPIMRQQGHGHIVAISSMGGLVAMPLAGAYIASKWALEGLTDSLAQEVAGFGINVTLVEPGPFATDQGGASSRSAQTIDDYQAVRDAQAEQAGMTPADPARAAAALLRVVDAANPPRRIILGDDALIDFVEHVYTQRIAEWRASSTFFR